MRVFGEGGTNPGQFLFPTGKFGGNGGRGRRRGDNELMFFPPFPFPPFVGIAVSPNGDFIAVCDYYNHRVQVLDKNYNFLYLLGGEERGGVRGWRMWGGLQAPMGVCIDSCERIVIADTQNSRVVVVRGGRGGEREGGGRWGRRGGGGGRGGRGGGQREENEEKIGEIIRVLPMIFRPLSVAVDEGDRIVVCDSTGVLKGWGRGGEGGKGEWEGEWEEKLVGGESLGMAVYGGRIIVADMEKGDVKVLY